MESAKLKDAFRNYQTIVSGAIIALSIVIAVILGSQCFSRTINVEGVAERDVESDYIVWKGLCSRQEKDLATAYKKLARDIRQVKEYFISRGFKEAEITFSSVYTETLYRPEMSNEIEAYRLSQNVEIRSTEVEKVDAVSRQVTELIAQGLHFDSSAPEYFYNKANGSRTALLAQATRNAKEKAEAMAGAVGRKISHVSAVYIEDISVLPFCSKRDPEDEGDDILSRKKKIIAQVSATFEVK
jgi:hypothetical protein